ncbi:MAG: hypothetical protein WA973_06915 [Mesorhizobium sp.]
MKPVSFPGFIALAQRRTRPFRITFGAAVRFGWLENRQMAEDADKKRPVVSTAQAASGADEDNTLLPMLIGGLIMIVIGAIVLMMFV